MKATYGNTTVRAWKINRENKELDWVKENFDNGNFFFTELKLFRAPTTVSLGGGIYGKVGDILIQNGMGVYTIISEKKFRKRYKNIEEEL
ncbi:hypothetical protein ACFO26_01190 [Lactococcus nasutitermitis]|uniref:Uncharacterized protein n=1 Tax=Lactococcus nasutitermitis TaxID=1652957 RepID=A0ABV9J9P2_9LACT|nr:hypothetical protein [Lactococcus nasutitermitis]